MISRYTTPEMTKIWSDENRFRKWLDVEIAVCRVLARRGIVPEPALRLIEKKASFKIERIYEIERTTHHDVIAFTTAVAETLGEESRFIHYGLTSTDVVDTAQALVLREAITALTSETEQLAGVLREAAFRHKTLPIIGRTHGVHAEPTTVGLKFALWYAETERNLQRLAQAGEAVICGKISGAVGTFAHLDPSVEEEVCHDLGIAYAPVSTQILQRDRHAQFCCTLAIMAGTLEKIALEIRHLQRTEVREAEEPFHEGQKGSSAMPHKRNPVKCEQICGLARVVRANALTSLENQALWHERDISHSSAERVILPDSTSLIHYLTRNLSIIMKGLHIYPEKMAQNLEITKGMFFSGPLLLVLIDKGAKREDAYNWIQRNAMAVWADQGNFLDLVLADGDIRRFMSEIEIRQVFSLEHQLRHVDAIFHRVFGKQAPNNEHRPS